MFLTGKQKPFKPKPKPINLCVHVNLSISALSNLYTRSKQSKLNKPRSSCLQVDSIQTRSNELDSNRVLDAILTLELLNLHVEAPKLFC